MIDSLLNFATTPSTLLVIVALVCLLESLAFIGIVVPGIAILLALTSAAGHQMVSLNLLLLAGFLGAATGDIFSYFCGRYAAPTILRFRLVQQHPNWVGNSQQYFQRYGVVSVVLGRFIGPIRPVMPFVAGMCRMPPTLFVGVNLLSALLWSPIYLLPGYMLGYGSNLLPPYWLDLTLLLLPFFIGLLLLPPIHRALQPDGAVARATHRIPIAQEQLGAWFMLISSLLLFLACAFLQLNPLLQQWQQTVISLTQLIPDWSVDIMLWLTGLADPEFVIGATLIVCLNLLPRSPGNAIWFLLILLLLFAADQALNIMFTIETPQPGVADTDNFSGTRISLIGGLCVMLAVIFTTGIPAQHRRWIYLCCLFITLAIALSQILLGQNRPIDDLAGLSLGLSAAACYRLAFSQVSAPPGWKALLFVCVIIYGLLYTVLTG
ncbi:DedA family protein [Pontibacter sp. JAM-7]|uniref:DedA family protein n=1 Tax=Pontibacter sp. JAM-7 TaxID=3366581 RepID=UPI003AF6C0D5